VRVPDEEKTVTPGCNGAGTHGIFSGSSEETNSCEMAGYKNTGRQGDPQRCAEVGGGSQTAPVGRHPSRGRFEQAGAPCRSQGIGLRAGTGGHPYPKNTEFVAFVGAIRELPLRRE